MDPKQYNELPSGYDQIFTGECKTGDIVRFYQNDYYEDACGLIGDDIQHCEYYKVFRKEDNMSGMIDGEYTTYAELPDRYTEIYKGQCEKGDIVKQTGCIIYENAKGLIGRDIESRKSYRFFRKTKHPLLKD